jgi:enoyl-CoA hydratase/carnithine racemase
MEIGVDIVLACMMVIRSANAMLGMIQPCIGLANKEPVTSV